MRVEGGHGILEREGARRVRRADLATRVAGDGAGPDTERGKEIGQGQLHGGADGLADVGLADARGFLVARELLEDGEVGTDRLERGVSADDGLVEDGVRLEDLAAHGVPLGSLSGVDERHAKLLGAGARRGGLVTVECRVDVATHARNDGHPPREVGPALAERVGQVPGHGGLVQLGVLLDPDAEPLDRVAQRRLVVGRQHEEPERPV